MARKSSKIRFILLPLLCVVWQGIEYSEAQGTYDVPIVNVPTNPFDALWQYPMEGNGFKSNATHVFWPADRKLFSKFYMNLPHEGETMFGISEQIFIDTGKDIANVGATMGANDHLAFVKVAGPWNDKTSDSDEDSMGNCPMPMELPEDLESRLQIQNMKIGLLSKWSQVANLSGLIKTTASNPAQFLALSHMPYNPEYEKKLLTEMDEFSEGLTHDDYLQFDKTALTCFHLNPAGSEVVMEEDDTSGWWLPLKQNLISWGAMNWQKPIGTLRSRSGIMSLTIDESGNLNAVVEGKQLWKAEVDGIDYKNMGLFIAPPNALTHNIPDVRPQPPALPMEAFASIIRQQYNCLPIDRDLPWMPREELCPIQHFNSTLQALQEECGYPFKATEGCVAAFSNFWPCFNFYLRPSQKHNHGMDSINEYIPIMHALDDFPMEWTMRIVAQDIPWDVEFAHAMDILGLGV